MIIQKQILNQIKHMPPVYTFQKDHIKKIILQVLLQKLLPERSRTMQFISAFIDITKAADFR